MTTKISNFKFQISNFQNGFTLIELILYMGIFSILLLATVQMFTQIFELQTESEATFSTSSDGRYIINRLFYDVTGAQSISVGNPTSLSVVKDDGTFTYSLEDNKLSLTNETAETSDQINSLDSKVTGLTFTNVGNLNGKNTVKVVFTLESTAIKRSGPDVKTFQTTIGIR